MRSPADMQIVQLELTDACESSCGACTRLVPHVSKPFYMTVPQFSNAIASMDGWGGDILGVMGGNPVLHPQFEAISRLFAQSWGRPSTSANGRKPIADFSAYAMERLNDRSSGRGLWSSLGNAYYRHYETIQETYDYQCLNDHRNAGLHQGLLIERKEFCESNGLSDDQWLENRDKCWVQSSWSSSVNVHGAYFCEVAASIDNLLYGGKSAWPVESGWWKRKPSDFNDQLHLCNHCALAQPGPSVVAHDDKDIVGRTSLPLLQAVGSPAVKKGAVEVYDSSKSEHQSDGRRFRVDWYMPEPHMRVAPDNPTTKPQRVACVVVCVGYGDKLKLTLEHNAKLVDQLVVVTTSQDVETTAAVCSWNITHCKDEGFVRIGLVASDRCYDDNHAFNKGRMLNDGLAVLDRPDWVILTDADVFLNPELKTYLAGHAINPGCLYGTNRLDGTMLNGRFFRHHEQPHGVNAEPNGYFQLFNRRALAVRDRWPKVMSEEFCSAGGVDSWFMQQFPEDKRVMIPEIPVCHISHGEFGKNWNGLQPSSGKRWVQVAMITASGTHWLYEKPLTGKVRIRLTDTLNGLSHETDAEANQPVPRSIIRFKDDGPDKGIIFLGNNIGHHHIHVAALLEG